MNRRWNDGERTFGNVLAWVMLVSVLAAWARVGWVLFYPYEPMVVTGRMKVLDKVVQRGEQVFYLLDAEKKLPLTATVTRQLVNHFVMTMPAFASNIKTGKVAIAIPMEIPDWATPGTYYIRNTYAYVVSEFPKRTVTVMAESEPFEVVK
jgi:hypothetical protein